MKNLGIQFGDDKAILSRETYEELRAFCRMHGETDLPAFQLDVKASAAVIYPSVPRPEKKLTDE